MWGIVGIGGFGIQHTHPPENKRIITTTRSHSNALTNATVAALKPDEVLKVGGAGHKVIYIFFYTSMFIKPDFTETKYDLKPSELFGEYSVMLGCNLEFSTLVL